ncbi:MAG: PLP-dependent aspartate aminotransferase family protein [Polyangia bacterium]|jgi:cystathionine gamma-lyase|nr:PLP-dependent aspartate aminotransferase family protein [Polyangia bacterium]
MITSKRKEPDWGFSTRAVHAGEAPNLAPGGAGDVAVPIHLAATFARASVERPTGGYEYSRSGNPTRDALETRLASLEGARFGLVFASGLAAETAVALTLLRPGDHLVLFDDLYGGSRRLFDRIFGERWGVAATFVDARSTDAVREALRPETRMVWLESPTNPLLKLCDIRAVAELAHGHAQMVGKGPIHVVVDNTFATPFFQRPLALGADLVVHSTTKYLNGHSDSVGGAVLTDNPCLHKDLGFHQNAAGAVLSPFDSYLVLRGTKTLGVRMPAHAQGALQVARFLEGRPEVERVIYPGLPSHPQHELAREQMSGFGGMVSAVLRGGLPRARAFLEALEVFALAESLGGVESLAESPALMTHASVPPEERARIGLPDGLVRLSVGIEDPADLIADLSRALSAAPPGQRVSRAR